MHGGSVAFWISDMKIRSKLKNRFVNRFTAIQGRTKWQLRIGLDKLIPLSPRVDGFQYKIVTFEMTQLVVS